MFSKVETQDRLDQYNVHHACRFILGLQDSTYVVVHIDDFIAVIHAASKIVYLSF